MEKINLIRLIKFTNIDKMYHDDIFLNLSAIESIALIIINLSIISKISDLSKVVFMKAPIVEHNNKIIHSETHRVSINNPISDTTMLEENFGINTRALKENVLINEMSQNINTLIEEGNIIYIYRACSSISIMEKDLNDRLILESRFAHIKEDGKE